MDLKSSVSVAEFFHQAVCSTLERQGVAASEPTEFYLVNLLSDFAHTPVDDEPLALKLARAVDASPDDRANQLKNVGDTSLYVSGFFAESLSRKLIDIDYYIQVGCSAYAELSHFFKTYRRSAIFSDVYGELGDKFREFVDVFGEVAEMTSIGGSNASAVSLYERWLRRGTPSDWMERRLRELGLLPPKEVH